MWWHRGEASTRRYLGPVIISFTPNPSLDRTAPLASRLVVGGTNRLGGVSLEAAGKGVNVSAAVHAAQHPTLAVVPADPDDPLTEALRARGVPARTVPVGHRSRTNLTIAHADGSTTKINEPGEVMTRENLTALVSAVMAALPGASWLTLCGSLPPGAPADWYRKLTQKAHEVGVRVAVDTNGPALDAVVACLRDTAPDLLTPNAAELEQASGLPVDAAAMAGSVDPARDAARALVDRGAPAVLATLGPLGAILATREGTWHAKPTPVMVRSAISAGDAALAGYLLAKVSGADDPAALARAVAYGSACVQKPGSAVPAPDEADVVSVTVEQIA